MITIDDFLLFADRTFDGFRTALDRLDDLNVNTLPDLPDSNSAYQLVIHTLAVVECWTSHIIIGNPSDREREAEFKATGSVAELRSALDQSQAQLHDLAPRLASATGLAHTPHIESPLGGEWTVGACMIHVYEELAQHLGHLEITVDLVVTSNVATSTE